jgi:DNA-directed RNA polymerase subunit K/omega
MTGTRNDDRRLAAIRRALELTTEALDLLDAHEGPPTAAAHLEMCRDKLREELARGEQQES